MKNLFSKIKEAFLEGVSLMVKYNASFYPFGR